MKFCPKCRNMLDAIDEDVVDGQKLAVMKCYRCEYKQPVPKENPVVYEHSLREDKTIRLAINPYLEYDPTLEHLESVLCPNKECPSYHGEKPDVVPVEINDVQLIWMYKCVNCKTMWKQNARAS